MSTNRLISASKPPKHSAFGRLGFRGAVLWTVIGTYLPGAGMLRAGRRLPGLIALALFTVLALGFVLWGVLTPSALLGLGVNSVFLKVLVVALPLVVLGWAALVVTSHLWLRPRFLTRAERLGGAVLVSVLVLTIATPLAVAARYSFDQSRFLETVFKSWSAINSGTAPQLDSRNPWKNKPRVNILLLGGDAGDDRWGTRTDTVMLASIDTTTGDTVLISLPRNTARMPFPEDSPLRDYYPNGFTNGWGESLEFMLTEMYQNVPSNVPEDILGPTDNLGADVVKLAVGEATGLVVDYYALVELDGFPKLINALGGITVNINTWVAIGGDTSAGIKPTAALSPGPNQHLDGAEALWYARGRYGSDDFQRMDRQRCVIDAVIKQANPTNVLTRYEDLTRQGKDMILTDIPQEMLPAMVNLAMRVKDGQSTSIVLRNGEDGFVSSDPDFDRIRARVAAATTPQDTTTQDSSNTTPAPVSETAPADLDEPTDPATEAAPTPGTPAPLPPRPAEDLSDSCAFKPELAAAQPPAPPWDS